MKKSEKRRIGEARQALYLATSTNKNLEALNKARAAEKRRKAANEEKEAKLLARKQAFLRKGDVIAAMNRLGENASQASKSMTAMVVVMADSGDDYNDYPEVLDMTDESYAS